MIYFKKFFFVALHFEFLFMFSCAKTYTNALGEFIEDTKPRGMELKKFPELFEAHRLEEIILNSKKYPVFERRRKCR